jgi:hypothetical protein
MDGWNGKEREARVRQAVPWFRIKEGSQVIGNGPSGNSFHGPTPDGGCAMALFFFVRGVGVLRCTLLCCNALFIF